ncbi:MAG TPA: penicillin-binding transpeptidase domain-containing protein [Anaerolineae bacterium]|nr:penicillin-binding transpeptidase domain-containing protein [Anaerolineae bacterium]
MHKATKFLIFLFLTLTLISCDALPRVEDSYNVPTLTPLAPTPAPTIPAAPPGADGVGLAFFRAWELNDYLGMYSLLSPQSQALVDSQTFVALYEDAMTTATVQSISSQPLASVQDGTKAEMEVQVTWQTAVIGNISRKFTVPLTYVQDRWGIVWTEALILPELAGGNQLQLTLRTPARANIYDKNNTALAYQSNLITLGVVPGQITDEFNLLTLLSTLLKTPAEDLKERYANAQPTWYVPLGNITAEMMQANYNQLEPFLSAGLTTDPYLGRVYNNQKVAPHIIGFTGPIPAEDIQSYLQAGYQPDEWIGRAGIERWGEGYLRGQPGGILDVRGPNNEYVTTLAESSPRQARSLHLTFDANFQTALEKALADALRPLGRNGAVVVLDVNTGAVRGLASYPTFDPTLFGPSNNGRQQELQALLNDSQQPLLNRVTQGQYPAGSVFKLVTFTAGLKSDLFTPSSRYNSTGTWAGLGENLIKRDWREGGHGNVSLTQAIVVSCNSCFYEVAYQIDQQDSNLFPTIAEQFGFGSVTGLDGVVEASGLVPSPQWKLNNRGQGWSRGDAVNMGIGQGDLLVTPLQIANMMAAVANDGQQLIPYLIDRIGASGNAPEERWPVRTSRLLPLTPDELATLQKSLLDVTTAENGTATHRFVGLPFAVAGKTGTAETLPGLAPHAWFAGYAPATPYTTPAGESILEPQIAIAVLVEHGGEGSATAAPIFRRAVELYYNLTPITPYPWE